MPVFSRSSQASLAFPRALVAHSRLSPSHFWSPSVHSRLSTAFPSALDSWLPPRGPFPISRSPFPGPWPPPLTHGHLPFPSLSPTPVAYSRPPKPIPAQAWHIQFAPTVIPEHCHFPEIHSQLSLRLIPDCPWPTPAFPQLFPTAPASFPPLGAPSHPITAHHRRPPPFQGNAVPPPTAVPKEHRPSTARCHSRGARFHRPRGWACHCAPPS